ncbi:MAG: hypothetical protein ACI9BW_001149 [Gammaproteobacteria bacterium]|jgi:hypothetical protein
MPQEPFCVAWAKFSREETCEFYWPSDYQRYLDELEQLRVYSWMGIDSDRVDAAAILQLDKFLGLGGLREDSVQAQLDERINSSTDRIDEPGHELVGCTATTVFTHRR